MAFVRPPKTRASFADGPRGFEIVIPAKRNWLMLAFLTFWLGGWTIGGFFALAHVLRGEMPAPARAFLIFWLGGWLVGELAVVYVVGWQLSGRERVSLAPGTLSIARELFGVRRVKRYDLLEVRNLRVAVADRSSFGSVSADPWGVFRGTLAFDYGAATVHFGLGVSEGEADQIRQALATRHAFA